MLASFFCFLTDIQGFLKRRDGVFSFDTRLRAQNSGVQGQAFKAYRENFGCCAAASWLSVQGVQDAKVTKP